MYARAFAAAPYARAFAAAPRVLSTQRVSDDPSHRHAAHHMLTAGATLSGKCASSRVPHPRSCGVHIV